MIERTITFGNYGGLIATILTPSPGLSAAAATGFIFFNAGIVHRVGVHRTNVTIARTLATHLPRPRFPDGRCASRLHPESARPAISSKPITDRGGGTSD